MNGERPGSDSERTVRFALRTDLLVAVSALIFSAIVAVAAVSQTHVIANQLSASVWPYLSFTKSESDTLFRFELTNNGLGPAIVGSAMLSLDGKTEGSLRQTGFAALGGAPNHSSLSTSSFGDGDVIRPGETFELLRFAGPGARRLATSARRRLKVVVCYCSLLDQCWTLSSAEDVHRPQKVARCERRPGFGA